MKHPQEETALLKLLDSIMTSSVTLAAILMIQVSQPTNNLKAFQFITSVTSRSHHAIPILKNK